MAQISLYDILSQAASSTAATTSTGNSASIVVTDGTQQLAYTVVNGAANATPVVTTTG